MMWFGAPKPAGQPPGILQPECLFSGPLPLIFRTATTDPTGCEVKRSDTVVADISYTPTSSSKRALEIKLTDAADPFFLWQCVLTEEDYFQMRREQSLVVDFGRFPAFLIGLVERCQQHFAESHPLFAAHFYTESPQHAILSLVETNEYKQNSYAVLRMTPVSEAAMRKHLSNLMGAFKEEIQSLRTTTTGSFPPRSTLPTHHATPYGNTQPQAYGNTQPHAYGNTQPQAYGNTQPRNYVERCRSLEERQAAMEQELRDLHEAKAKLEAETNELRGQHKIYQSENERLKQDVYLFRSQNGVSAKMSALEQVVREKDDALTRLNDLVQETREAKSLLESTISQLRQQLQTSQEQHLHDQQQAQKLHDIIRKLQDDLRTAKSKVRSASTLAQEQERLRRDAQSQVDVLKVELQQLRAQYDAKLGEVGELEGAKRGLQRELEDVRHLNEGNEKVISWLHRLIPDDRLTGIIERGDTADSFAPAVAPQPHIPAMEPQSQSETSSDYPLAMRREVRQFFNDLGVQIDAETSLPRFTPEELRFATTDPHDTVTRFAPDTSTRFTPEELAEKQTAEPASATGTTSSRERRREGLDESMGSLTIV